MYRYKNLHFRFSAGTCTSTFVTANIFPWYLLISENFAKEAVQHINYLIACVLQFSVPAASLLQDLRFLYY